MGALALVVSLLSLAVSSATLAMVWRRPLPTMKAIEDTAELVVRQLRHGSAAHELEQRGKSHELRNRMVHFEERLWFLEEATGHRHPLATKRNDTPPEGSGQIADDPASAPTITTGRRPT
jgi:hypothetical protein